MPEEQETSSREKYVFIHENDVAEALTAAEGTEAQLERYEIRDFIKKGDNYLGVITSVAVFYILRGVRKQTSFIVKATPVHTTAVQDFTMFVFTKESDFYSKLVPLLDQELKNIGQPPLQVPKCYLTIARNGGKVLYLEDLRLGDFKICDRLAPLDLEHITFICQELARLHAAGSLLMTKNRTEGLELMKLFPCLEDQFSILKRESNVLTSYEDFFKTNVSTGILAAEINPGYEKMSQFLRQKIPKAHELYDSQRQTSSSFFSICHGDAWNNNFLFRYDSSGHVTECKLLDLQFHRVTSVVADFHYLSYTSVDRDFKKKHWDAVLETYYSSHAAIMRAAGFEMKFSAEELKQEYKDKSLFGLITGLLMIPLVCENSDEVVDVDVLLKKLSEDDKKQLQLFVLKKLKTNSLMNSRMLEMFDDMMEASVVV